MSDTPGEVTLEQANQALSDILAAHRGESASEEPAAQEPVAQEAAPEPEAQEPVKQESAPAEPETEAEPEQEAVAATAEPEEVQSDDVESLKKRLSEATAQYEADQKAASARTEAISARSRQNEEILRKRFLGKSAAADLALKTLRAIRSQEGTTEAEIDRVIAHIQGTMNPNSPSYAPPPDANLEDQAIILNNFLNERGLGNSESDAFANWMRHDAETVLEPSEKAIAERDLDAFLRIAYRRYIDDNGRKEREKQRGDAVAAVRAVQRTQRQQARAASAASTPRRTATPGKAQTQTKELTPADISTLVKMAWEEAQ